MDDDSVKPIKTQHDSQRNPMTVKLIGNDVVGLGCFKAAHKILPACPRAGPCTAQGVSAKVAFNNAQSLCYWNPEVQAIASYKLLITLPHVYKTYPDSSLSITTILLLYYINNK